MILPTESKHVPQPHEWQTLDDVLAWAEHEADIDALYIAKDLARVVSLVARQLGEKER